MNKLKSLLIDLKKVHDRLKEAALLEPTRIHADTIYNEAVKFPDEIENLLKKIKL